MRHRLLATAAAIAIAAGAMAALAPASLAQAPESGPGIVVSIIGSATISTKGMSPGSEIWAVWYSLPAGKTVVEPASGAKWAWFEMALGGAAVVTGTPTPMCRPVSAGGFQAAGSERVSEAGDVEVCNYAILPESRTENRGAQPYVFAGLAVGGPWKEGMEDDIDLYLKVNGMAKAVQVRSAQFRDVEKEILDAGAMTVAIRNVTLPPGARIAATDRYPTLRMVGSGQLNVARGTGGAPKALAAHEMLEWAPGSAEEQIVLSNNSGQPAQFVEWTVAPAQGVNP